MTKNFVRRAPYFRNHTSYDCHFGCKCVKLYLQVFFSMLKFWFSRLSSGWKGKKWPKMLKISVYCTLYFRNHISYDPHFWYTCMYKKIKSSGIFSIFFQNFDIWDQKIVTNQNRTSHDRDFWCTCVKWWCLQQIFSLFRILIFGVFSGIKGKKYPEITNFSLFCSISQEL